MKGRNLGQRRVGGVAEPLSAPQIMEGLLGVSWYTSDPQHPYLVRAAANKDTGFCVLVTDMEKTYFCKGDIDCIKNDKKVCRKLKSESCISEVQSYDKDR